MQGIKHLQGYIVKGPGLQYSKSTSNTEVLARTFEDIGIRLVKRSILPRSEGTLRSKYFTTALLNQYPPPSNIPNNGEYPALIGRDLRIGGQYRNRFRMTLSPQPA